MGESHGFRQKGKAISRGFEATAQDANPSPESGEFSSRLGRPVWKQFVGDASFQSNNERAIRAEQDYQKRTERKNAEIQRDRKAGKWTGSDGKLFRTTGNQVEEFDAEEFAEHPKLWRQARKSMFDHASKGAAAELAEWRLRLKDPTDKRALTDKQRSDLEHENQFLKNESDPQNQAILKANRSRLLQADERRADEKAAYDAEVNKYNLSSQDPEAWYQSRPKPGLEDKRRDAVAQDTQHAARVNAADESAAMEIAGLDEKIANGVRGSELEEITAKRAELMEARATIAEERQKIGEASEAVRGEAVKSIKDENRASEAEFRGKLGTKGAVDLTGQKRGLGEIANFGMNNMNLDYETDVGLNVMIGKNGGREQAREYMQERKERNNKILSNPQSIPSGRVKDGTSRNEILKAKELENARIGKWLELLDAQDAEFAAAGITDPAERERIFADATKENEWTASDDDNVRTLSTGEVAINPGRIYGDYDGMVADIRAKSGDESTAIDAIARLDAWRQGMAKGIADAGRGALAKVNPFDEYEEYEMAMLEAGIDDKVAILDGYAAQKKGRKGRAKMADALITGVTEAGAGIYKTVVGTTAGLAGAVQADGVAGYLGEHQINIGSVIESSDAGSKLRGQTGGYSVTKDLTNTVGQMSPMLVGGQYAQGLKGISQTVVAGMSVYGVSFAQGYESKNSDSLSIAEREKGSALNREEIGGVLTSLDTQVAAFANGAKTVLLAKTLGGGSQRAALGKLGKPSSAMTVKDFLSKGGRKALADSTLRKELGKMGKQIFADAGDEFVEEGLDQFLDAAISSVVLGEDFLMGDVLSESFHAGLMGAAVGGMLPQFRKSGGRSPLEQVNRSMVATDPMAEPAEEAEINRATEISNPDDGVKGVAAGVAIERELAEIEAGETAQLEEAEDALWKAQDSGDNAAVKAAETRVDTIKAKSGQANRVRAVLKLASGRGIQDLTRSEIASLGYKATEDGQGAEPMTPDELKAAGLDETLIYSGPDGSPIVLDAAIKMVEATSPKARAAVKLTEAQQIEAAKGRAKEAAKAEEEAAAGPEREFDVTLKSGATIRVTAKDETSAEQEAAASADEPIVPGTAVDVNQPAPGEQQDPSTGSAQNSDTAGNKTPSHSGAKGGAGDSSLPPSGKSPARPKFLFKGDPDEMTASLKGVQEWDAKYGETHFHDGTPKARKAPAKGGAGDSSLPPSGNSPTRPEYPLGDVTIEVETAASVAVAKWDAKYGETHFHDGTPKARKAPAKGGAGNSSPAKVPGAKALKTANKRLNALKKRSKRLTEAITLTTDTGQANAVEGKITINPQAIIAEAIAGGMTEAQAAQYFARVLDEEIRHLAQYDGARKLHAKLAPDEDFDTWRASYYAKIWDQEFIATGKAETVAKLYGKTEEGIAAFNELKDWQKAFEAIRLMSQGGKSPEAASLWVSMSKQLREAIQAALEALKSILADIEASPVLKAEIKYLEEALAQINEGAGAKNPPANKPPESAKGEATGGKESPKGSQQPGTGGTNAPASQPTGEAIATGTRVSFSRNGKTLTGKVTFVRKDGAVMQVELDAPTSEGLMNVAVQTTGAVVLAAPVTNTKTIKVGDTGSYTFEDGDTLPVKVIHVDSEGNPVVIYRSYSHKKGGTIRITNAKFVPDQVHEAPAAKDKVGDTEPVLDLFEYLEENTEGDPSDIFDGFNDGIEHDIWDGKNPDSQSKTKEFKPGAEPAKTKNPEGWDTWDASRREQWEVWKKQNPDVEVVTPDQAKSKLAEWKAQAAADQLNSSNSGKIVVSLFDSSGVWSKPWRDAGYTVYQFDLDPNSSAWQEDVKNLTADFLQDHGIDVVDILLAQPPCTDFSLAGNRWFSDPSKKAAKLKSLNENSALVNHTLDVIGYLRPAIWGLENPIGTIKKHTSVSEPRLVFDPFMYGAPYTKRTQIFGHFNEDLPQATVFPEKASLIHKLSGTGKGKGERSLTPEEFAYSFYMANRKYGEWAGKRAIAAHNGNEPTPINDAGPKDEQTFAESSTTKPAPAAEEQAEPSDVEEAPTLSEGDKKARNVLDGLFTGGLPSLIDQPIDYRKLWASHAELEAKHNAGTATSLDMYEARSIVEEVGLANPKSFLAVHGGAEGITSFDAERIKSQEAGAGFYFSTDIHAGHAENYAEKSGGIVYKVALTLNNPYYSSTDYSSPPANDPVIFDRSIESIRKSYGLNSEETSLLKEVFSGYSPSVLTGTHEFAYRLSNFVRSEGFNSLNKKQQAGIANTVNTLFGENGAQSKLDLIRLLSGHDGIVYKDGSVATSLSPYKIKSVEPFTGVPLSERFNPASDSILFTGGLPQDFNKTIPQDRFMALMDAANTWVAEGVDTPEKLGAKLEALAPDKKAIVFSQPFWFAMKASGSKGAAEPDWSKVYAATPSGEAKKAETPSEEKDAAESGLAEKQKGDLKTSIWKPNHLVFQALSFPDYERLGIIQIEHDGSEESIKSARDLAEKEANNQFGGVSHSGSMAIATDKSGKPVNVVSPNGRVSLIDSADGRYAAGDLNAFRDDSLKRILAAKEEGNIEEANNLAQERIDDIEGQLKEIGHDESERELTTSASSIRKHVLKLRDEIAKWKSLMVKELGSAEKLPEVSRQSPLGDYVGDYLNSDQSTRAQVDMPRQIIKLGISKGGATVNQRHMPQ